MIDPKSASILKSLSVTPGRIPHNFWSHRDVHCVYVTQDTESVQITAETEAEGDSFTINGEAAESGGPPHCIEVSVGRNIIPVEVTTPGKTATVYQVRVFRSYPTPTWKRVAETCPWIPRDSCGELVFNDRMWLFGGYTPEVINDVWSTPDGINWGQHESIPCESGKITSPVTLVYNDKMWIESVGGKLFSSSDGTAWSIVTDNAPWKNRGAAAGAVFNGRMWVMGGTGVGGLKTDIWSTSDGVEWILESENPPWSGRQLFGMLPVHDGKMWIIGGGICIYHPFKAYNDVWATADGKNWEKITDQAPWPPRIWSSSAVYKNRLWLLTGFQAEPTWNNFDDVWYSSDGGDWNELVTETKWSPRHEVSVYVFDDKLWAVGGNAWPLQNDVWYLEIPGLCFLTQPIIEEFVNAQYTYRAKADFNENAAKVRYRLIESPDWLNIDSESGQIRGTPRDVEDVTVTVEAFDEAGETARQTYLLHILPFG